MMSALDKCCILIIFISMLVSLEGNGLDGQDGIEYIHGVGCILEIMDGLSDFV